MSTEMSTLEYQVRETQNRRWGIYLQDRLLATIGNYEACQLLQQSLNENLSDLDNSKALVAYDRAVA